MIFTIPSAWGVRRKTCSVTSKWEKWARCVSPEPLPLPLLVLLVEALMVEDMLRARPHVVVVVVLKREEAKEEEKRIGRRNQRGRRRRGSTLWLRGQDAIEYNTAGPLSALRPPPCLCPSVPCSCSRIPKSRRSPPPTRLDYAARREKTPPIRPPNQRMVESLSSHEDGRMVTMNEV